MKQLLAIISMLLFISLSIKGQNIERQVIGSAGTTFSNSSITAEFTVGEIATAIITDGTTTLSQGFHQNVIRVQIMLNPSVYIQGAALNPNTGEENLMRDDLRVANLLPTTSPYADALTCETSVFNTTGNNAIVDWVWIELRDKNDSTSVLHSQSALLQRDGDVVSLDGVSVLSFEANIDTYFIALKHRNHLGVMTASTVALSDTTTIVDFTDANNEITYGSNAQTITGMQAGVLGMWAADTAGSGAISFIGSGSASAVIKDTVLDDPGNLFGSLTYKGNGYSNADTDLNGSFSIIGSGSDTSIVKDNVLNHPGNIFGSLGFSFSAQLP